MNITPINARMASILLVFGIFFAISCASSSSSVEQNSSELSNTETYERDLSRINEALNKSPENEELILDKAKTLENLAQSYSYPQPRFTVYQNLRELANEPTSQNSSIEDNLNEILVRSWNREQSSGVKLLQDTETILPQDQFETVVTHFENATAIMPDSTVTYTLLATTYYRNGHLNDAIGTLKEADRKSDSDKPSIKEKLAYLYLESGDIEQSIDLYRNLTDDNPDDPHIKHGLANAYMLNKQHREAVNLLRELTEEYPTRYSYFESLAAELFFIFNDEIQSLINNPSVDSVTEDELISIIDYMKEIDSIFTTLTERLPQSEEIVFRMASTYKNASFLLSDLIPLIDEELQENFSQLPDIYLEQSLSYWERLLEINPDNPEYFDNLYQVYVRLNMEEQAESIERTFNY